MLKKECTGGKGWSSFIGLEWVSDKSKPIVGIKWYKSQIDL